MHGNSTTWFWPGAASRKRHCGTAARADFATPLAALALLAELAISGNLLAWVGIPYTQDGGVLIEKLHPGTYLSAAACAVRLIQYGSKVRAARLLCSAPGILSFNLAMAGCIIFAMLLHGPGGAVALMDTFLPAGLICVALADARPSQLRVLRLMLQWMFMVNACLCLAEVACGRHFIPISELTPEPLHEFRPTGLYDHPLTASLAMMMALFLNQAARPPAALACVTDAILLTALIACGGRAALLLTVVAAAGGFVVRLRTAIVRHAISVGKALAGLAGAVAASGLMLVAISYGLAERLLHHMYWDASAQSRLAEFHILGALTPLQLVFGCRRAEILPLIEAMRLQYGADVIENFWLLMFCNLGLLGFPMFVLGFAALCRVLMAYASGASRLLVVMFVLAASCSNSLGRKSTLLVILVGVVAASGAIATPREAGTRALWV